MSTHNKINLGVEEEVDLLEYLYGVLRNKYRILIIAMTSAVAVFIFSLFIDEIYMSTALVGINIRENPGGVAPENYRAADALGLMEHEFIIDGIHSNERDRLMARMRSFKFTKQFVQDNNLVSYIFYKHWDAIGKKWMNNFNPDIRDAVKIFNENMRALNYDEKTGLLQVIFKTRDPLLSADLANKFIVSFNAYIKEIESHELKNRRAYLENRLTQIENTELHRSIYRMLETQLTAESLLYARLEYPLEVIQPAMAPIYKIYPSRKKWAALSFVGFLMLGIMITIGSILLKKLREHLDDYKNKELSSIERSEPLLVTPDDQNKNKQKIPEDDEWID